jgi:threonyl-tRNA synthetase
MGYYIENMYVFEKGGEQYVVKPMNCPFHILIYQTKTRSYRDLPIRYTELGTVYRYERSGTLHGLMRVRGFTQDDAHIFCTPEQLEDEIIGLLDLTLHILRTMGFQEFEVVLSTRDPEHPERYMGTAEEWSRAQEALVRALKRRGLPYEEAPGEAVFYGPKIDIKLVDAIGRTWQCTTIQIDFNLPRRFNVTYIGPDGKEHLVVMIHRALLGSLERFIGVLLEHYAGNLPVWLSPIQVRVMPISDKYVEQAAEIYERLRAEGIRAELDDRGLTIAYRIREAEEEKIPYMVVVGRREVESETISVRRHRLGDLGQFTMGEFLERILREVTERK